MGVPVSCVQRQSCCFERSAGTTTPTVSTATAARSLASCTPALPTPTTNATYSGAPLRKSSTESSSYVTLSALFCRSYSFFPGRSSMCGFVRCTTSCKFISSISFIQLLLYLYLNISVVFALVFNRSFEQCPKLYAYDNVLYGRQTLDAE